MPRIWSFGGGKGGVGKSLVCASVGVSLARRGQRVIVVDTDFGAANLHTLLGILYPDATLADYFAGRVSRLGAVCLDTPVDGLRLVSGAATLLGTANPHVEMRQRFIRALLELDADHVLVDLGAGTHYDALDLFNLAAVGLVVTSTEPTSVQNAYGFLKAAAFRWLGAAVADAPEAEPLVGRALLPRGAERIESMSKLCDILDGARAGLGVRAREALGDFRARLVVNQATERRASRVTDALASVSRRYLGVDVERIAALPRDEAVVRAVQRMEPVGYAQRDAPFARAIDAMVERLLADARLPRTADVVERLLAGLASAAGEPHAPGTEPVSASAPVVAESIADPPPKDTAQPSPAELSPRRRTQTAISQPAGSGALTAQSDSTLEPGALAPGTLASPSSVPSRGTPIFSSMSEGLASTLADALRRHPAIERDALPPLDPALDPWADIAPSE